MSGKIFCIGMNKTGTTSLSKALSDLGIKLAPQYIGESFCDEYIKGYFYNLLNYINNYEAFQDNPFSISGIHKMLYHFYPDSKFILSIRNSPEEWYNSLVRYHTKLFSSDKTKPPTSFDLINSYHINKSWMYRIMKFKYGTPDNDIYNKKILINHYVNHYRSIVNFFFNKKNQLLIINLDDKNSYKNFCNFLNKDYIEGKTFPHLNKS